VKEGSTKLEKEIGMSTRAAIIMKDGDKYRGIYSHWDGYISGVGKDLQKHYKKKEKIRALIDLGAISVLGAKVDPKGEHSFDHPEKGVTVAYGRDRGEKDCGSVTGDTVDEVAGQIGHNGYVYVWEDGKWVVNGQSLAEALAEGKD
jgi:hypothetical protein